MSDTPFNSFPTAPKSPGEMVSGETSQRSNSSNVKIISLSEELKTEQSRPSPSQRIEGRVIQSDPKTNRLTVRTEKGDIEVQLPKERALPERGTPVEIKLPPPDSKQQTATLRPLPPPPLPPQTDQVNLNTSRPLPPGTYQSPSGTPPQGNPQPLPPLQAGQTVRITPLPPSLLPNIQIAPLPPTLTATPSLPALSPILAASQPAAPTALMISPVTPPPSLPILNTVTPTTFSPPSLTTVLNGEGHLPASSFLNVFSSGQPATTGLIKTTLSSYASSPPSPSQPLATTPSQIQLTPPLFNPSTPLRLTQALQQQPPAFLSPLAGPAQLPATVIGQTAQGQPVISLQFYSAETAPQFFTLQNVSLPLGATLSFPVTELAAATTTNVTATQSSLPLPAKAESLFQMSLWPALNEVLEVLQQTNPTLAGQLLQIIPSARTPASIPPALLLFLAAVKGGDMSAWIGEKPADLLRRIGRNDLINRLGADGASLNRVTSESLPNDWRGMVFPFHSGQGLQNITVYYKQDEAPSETEDSKKQTRFIFDMNLSRMGDVQIDGLFKPAAGQTRLDLVVRTEADLSDDMKLEMRRNYANVLRYGDLAGELSFQGEKASFVKILTRTETHRENIKFMT